MSAENSSLEVENQPAPLDAVTPTCLRLSLKTKWFEMTKAGIKTEDYREINAYWIKRLTSQFSWDMNKYPLKLNEHKQVQNKGSMQPKKFDCNIMTLGYPKSTDTARIIKLKHKGIKIGTGNPEWGAEPNKLYFVIMHGVILGSGINDNARRGINKT